jgi:2-polyprenyl-3-methyl-5-hydroxy-6-metoxy-1,4-benzoquinol methylase
MSTSYFDEANQGVLRHVGTGERILDIGAGRGRLGAAMRARGNVVHGVELDVDAAAVARGRLDFVHCGDATRTAELPPEIAAGGYDRVVFADVLEHVLDGRSLLRAARPLLRPGGEVVVSIPNVATWTMRLRLLAGDFTYGDSGTLDRTHLRFFTHRSARALLRSSGLSIVAEDVTPSMARALLPAVKSVLVGRDGGGDPGAIVDSPAYKVYARYVEPIEAGIARLRPTLLAFQMILVARFGD